MVEMKTINLEVAKGMSEYELRLEIRKHFKYLIEKFGMNREEAANFMTSVLNLGVAMQEHFDQKKSK